MKKVLIITYYWPPSGGAGVHRWLKFVKYLRNYGWEPVIFTPENPEAPAHDDTLASDIPEGVETLKTKVWEPYKLYKIFIGAKKEQKVNAGFLSESKKPRLTEKIAVWLRGNFFIPDARVFWIKPSVKYLTRYLAKNHIDAMVSTGPPHSLHRIALKVHKKTSIPWLADFRDLWTGIDFYDQLMLTSIANKIHHRMEKQVLDAADKIVTVSRNCAIELEKLCNKEISVINNGFDESDFDNINVRYPEKFCLSHVGALNKDRNPEFLWETISLLVEEIPGLGEDLKIDLVGKTDISVLESIKRNKLEAYTFKTDYLSHQAAIEREFSSAVLLLLINNTPNSLGIAPGKLFEYMATGRPILCIGPEEGDSAAIIRDSGTGEVVAFDDKENLKDVLSAFYEDYKQGTLKSNKTGTDKYKRSFLAGGIAKLLDEITS